MGLTGYSNPAAIEEYTASVSPKHTSSSGTLMHLVRMESRPGSKSSTTRSKTYIPYMVIKA